MTYTVQLTASAKKALGRMPPDIRERLTLAVAALRSDPRPPGVVKLTGEDNVYRVRVGDYRILYEIHDNSLIVIVVKIAHRRDAYRPE